jgi:hypothetical protein
MTNELNLMPYGTNWMKKLAMILMLVSLPFLSGACNDLTRFVKPNIDATLLLPCDDPVFIPERDLTQEEVERYWGEDRSRLVACRDKHTGLVTILDPEAQKELLP